MNTLVRGLVVFAFFGFVYSPIINAQLAYTELNTLVSADTVQVFARVDIPLSGGTSSDFYLKDFHPQKDYWDEEAYSTQTVDEVCVDTVSGSPVAFDTGQTIAASQTMQWVTSASGSGSSAMELDSTWKGQAHYLGVRINQRGSWHYGWIKLQLNAMGSGFRLLGYCYDQTPDQQIKAADGEQSAGVATVPTKNDCSLSVYPNPFHQTTAISFSSNIRERVQVTIVNLLGNPVSKLFDGELDAGEHSFEWNVTSLLPGWYECIIQMNGQVESVPVVLIQ
jgi:Secretion system C-terminal sorting domain